MLAHALPTTEIWYNLSRHPELKEMTEWANWRCWFLCKGSYYDPALVLCSKSWISTNSWKTSMARSDLQEERGSNQVIRRKAGSPMLPATTPPGPLGGLIGRFAYACIGPNKSSGNRAAPGNSGHLKVQIKSGLYFSSGLPSPPGYLSQHRKHYTATQFDTQLYLLFAWFAL